MSPDTVLVTGGAGFIGSTLAHALVQRGRRVVVFDDLSFGREHLIPQAEGRCVFARGDLRDPARVTEVVREFRPRQVYHLGAIHFIPYCNAHPEDTRDINVNGTRNVLDACREFPPEVVLLASTAAVYPIDDRPVTEDTAPGPIDVYGRTKLLAEELGRAFHDATGVPTILARFFNAFGPNETNPHLIPAILDQLREGGDVLRLGNLDPVRDYVHTADLVEAVIGLADAFRQGTDTFNVGSGQGASVVDVVRAFERALGRRLEIQQDASRLRAVERAFLVADVGKIRGVTGWTPRTSLEAGISALVDGLDRPRA